MRFRADTFTGLSKMIDEWLENSGHYMDCTSIVFERIDEGNDYYWIATIKFK